MGFWRLCGGGSVQDLEFRLERARPSMWFRAEGVPGVFQVIVLNAGFCCDLMAWFLAWKPNRSLEERLQPFRSTT